MLLVTASTWAEALTYTCHPELDDLIGQVRAVGVTFTINPDGSGVTAHGARRLTPELRDKLTPDVKHQIRDEILCYPDRFAGSDPKPVTVSDNSSGNNDAGFTVLLIVGAIVAIALGLVVLYIALAVWPLTVIILLAIIAFHMC
jgi:hypothetical protein